MKKLIILLLLTSSCLSSKTKQQRAEQTVIAYIQVYNPAANVKDIHFTTLDTKGNVVGIIEDKTVYDTNHHPMLITNVYYMLNEDLTKVTGIFTN